MGSIWTVARQTFSQCLRTKVAAVFTVLLVASLAVLPSVMVGDGTLAGRIRTFLDYSFSVVSALLSLVVIFLAVGLVSGDVRDKHVFIVCVKPLGRWQYVLGRWLGIVLLSSMLLGGRRWASTCWLNTCGAEPTWRFARRTAGPSRRRSSPRGPGSRPSRPM